ncbi:hypothetical protein [Achromobacter aloeverae]
MRILGFFFSRSDISAQAEERLNKALQRQIELPSHDTRMQWLHSLDEAIDRSRLRLQTGMTRELLEVRQFVAGLPIKDLRQTECMNVQER